MKIINYPQEITILTLTISSPISDIINQQKESLGNVEELEVQYRIEITPYLYFMYSMILHFLCERLSFTIKVGSEL